MHLGPFRLAGLPKIGIAPELFLDPLSLFCWFGQVEVRAQAGFNVCHLCIILICMLANHSLTCAQVWLDLGWGMVSRFGSQVCFSFLFELDQILPALNCRVFSTVL